MRVCVKRSDGISTRTFQLWEGVLIFDTKINRNSDSRIILLSYLKPVFATANDVIHDIDLRGRAKSMVYVCKRILEAIELLIIIHIQS